MCDKHEDRPAVKRVQGETDSFGCEYFFACQECLEDCAKATELRLEEESYCNWCKSLCKGCQPLRDVDEGTCGPVYSVCPACRTKYDDYLEQELAEYRKFDYLGEYYFDDYE